MTATAADLEKVSRGSEIQGTLTSLPGRIPTPDHLFHSPGPSAQFGRSDAVAIRERPLPHVPRWALTDPHKRREWPDHPIMNHYPVMNLVDRGNSENGQWLLISTPESTRDPVSRAPAR